MDEETLELAVEEARELVPEAEVVAVSAKTGAGAGRAARRARAAADAVEPAHADGPDAALRRSRLHAARDRHGRDRHALVGDDRRRRRAARRAGGARRPRAERAGARPRGRRRRGGPARRRQPARDRARAAAARRRARRARRVPGELPARRRARGARADRAGARSPSTTAPRSPGRGSRDRRAATRSSGSTRAGRRRPRRPRRAAHAARPSAAGGRSTLLPPRRLEPERLELLERGDVAATVHAPVRARRSATSATLDGLERAGDWVFSSAWLDGAPGRRRADASPRPTRSTPGSTRRRSRGRRRSCRCSGWSGAARGSTCPALRRGSRAPTSCSPSSRPRLGPEAREGRRRRRSPAPRAAGHARPRRRRLRRRRAPRTTQARAALVEECTAAGQDHARALPRPARRRPPRGAAAARALRRRRPHPPGRRRARPPPRRAMTFWIALALVLLARRRGRWAIALLLGTGVFELSQTASGSGTRRSRGSRSWAPRPSSGGWSRSPTSAGPTAGVRVQGELWRARCAEGAARGERVRSPASTG